MDVGTIALLAGIALLIWGMISLGKGKSDDDDDDLDDLFFL